jgi:hypothetical protein
MSSRISHTAGFDSSARRKLNPYDAPIVSRKMVDDFADKNGIRIRREGQGMWFFWQESGWWVLGQTNYLALKHLQKIAPI